MRARSPYSPARTGRKISPSPPFSIGAVWALACAAACTLASAPPVAAQSGGSAAPPPAVTLSARGEDVRSVLKAAFGKVPGVKYRIEEGVRGTVTVSVRDLPLAAALRSIVRANTAPLELRRENDLWVVAPRRAPGAPAAPTREGTDTPAADPARVTLAVADAELPAVLAALFDRARNDAPHFGAKYRVLDAAARAARVTVRIDGLPLPEALDRVTRVARPRLTWRRTTDNVYEFQIEAASAAAATPAAVAEAALPRVSVDVRDGDVRGVLADVFRQAKVANYTLANDVVGYVTLKMKDRPLDEALSLICRTAVPPLRYRKTAEGVYEVRTRTYGNTTALSAPRAGDPPGEFAAAAVRTSDWEAIPLTYAEVDALTGAMNTLRPEGVTRVLGYLPTNTLLVKAGDARLEGFLALVLGYGTRGVGNTATTGGGATTGPGGAATPGGGPGGTPTGAGTGGGAANP